MIVFSILNRTPFTAWLYFQSHKQKMFHYYLLWMKKNNWSESRPTFRQEEKSIFRWSLMGFEKFGSNSFTKQRFLSPYELLSDQKSMNTWKTWTIFPKIATPWSDVGCFLLVSIHEPPWITMFPIQPGMYFSCCTVSFECKYLRHKS